MILQTDKKPIWRTVWFAVVLCCGVLGLSMIPAVYQAIQWIDNSLAATLNRAAGVSPVFDRIVLLIADEDGRERIVILVLAWFLISVFMVPGRQAKARLLGMFLFMGIVLTLFFIVDALLDDIFIRRSPSYYLKPFHSISKSLGYKVDLTEKRTFPSAEAMLLFTPAFLLLRVRRYLSGIIVLVLGLTVPLLKCVAGLSWASDIYLGALPIAYLVSAMAVETPFGRLLGTFIDLSAASIDQGSRFLRELHPMWRHRNLYWASQNVFHMESATKRFIRKDLADIVDPEKAHRDVRPVVEAPLGGLRSIVRIVTLGPLKVVVRAYSLNRRTEAEQHYRASELLARHGVRVPKVLFTSDGPKRHGALFIVEEFIDGASRKPAELSDSDIRSAAIELARLHQVKNQAWGPIESPRTEEYGTVFLRRIDRQISQVVRGQVLKGQQNRVAEVRLWFSQWRAQLNAIQEYSLVHGKLHRENCIFEKNGNFCLLDITTLEWGVPSNDLVLVHHSQCGSKPELIQKFDAIYYDALPPADAEQCQRLQALYDAYYCLMQVSKYTKRLGRGKRQVGDAVNKGMFWWIRMLEIIEEKNP